MNMDKIIYAIAACLAGATLGVTVGKCTFTAVVPGPQDALVAPFDAGSTIDAPADGTPVYGLPIALSADTE